MLPHAHYLFWNKEAQRCGVVFENGPLTDFSGINRTLLGRSDFAWTPPSPISEGDTTWVGYIDCPEAVLREAVTAARYTLQPKLTVTITKLTLSVRQCQAPLGPHGRAHRIYPNYMPGTQPVSLLSYAETLRKSLNEINWSDYLFPPGHDQHEQGMREGIDFLTDWLRKINTHVQQVELTPLFCCLG